MINLNNYPTLLNKYGINTPLRKAHFMAQIMAESKGISNRESLYFTTIKGLRDNFYSPFKGKKDTFVSQYLRNSEKCANYVYANRMGNGSESTGDGFKYRGGGLLQNTGRSQYDWLRKITGIDFVCDPDLIIQEANALIAALEYWKDKGLNKYADLDDLDSISDIINIGSITKSKGDANGYKHRLEYLNKYKNFYLVLLSILFISCNARKSEVIKETEKSNTVEKFESVSNDWFKEFEFNAIKESEFTFVRDFSESGNIVKETFSKRNKESNLVKTKEQLVTITKTVYKTIFTKKYLKSKSIQTEEPSKSWIVWIGLFVVIAVLIYFLISKYKPKIKDLFKFKK